MTNLTTSPQPAMAVTTSAKFQKMPGKNEVLPNYSPSVAAVDRDVLSRLRAELQTIAPGLIEELIELYVANSPELLAQMRQGIIHSDSETVKIAAHTLKSNSARLGAILCSQLCLELEIMGQNEQMDDALEKLAELELEFKRVETALQKG